MTIWEYMASNPPDDLSYGSLDTIGEGFFYWGPSGPLLVATLHWSGDKAFKPVYTVRVLRTTWHTQLQKWVQTANKAGRRFVIVLESEQAKEEYE